MAKFDDQETALARVYAAALLRPAVEANQVDTVREELSDLAGFVGRTPDFALFLASPTVDEEARKVAIEKLLRGRYSDLLVDALGVLNRNGRLGLIEAVAVCFRELDDGRRNRAEVVVRSAAALPESARVRLGAFLRKRTGREVSLIETIDESLLGGVVVQIGDEKLDMSVSRQLARMGEKLVSRASRELHGDRAYVEGVA